MYPRMASFPCNFTGCIVMWGEMTTDKRELFKVRGTSIKENNQGKSGIYGIQVPVMNGPFPSHIFTYLLIRKPYRKPNNQSLLAQQEIRKTEIRSKAEYLISSNIYLSKSMSTSKFQHRNTTIWGSVTSHSGIPEANMSFGFFCSIYFLSWNLIIYFFSYSPSLRWPSQF